MPIKRREIKKLAKHLQKSGYSFDDRGLVIIVRYDSNKIPWSIQVQDDRGLLEVMDSADEVRITKDSDKTIAQGKLRLERDLTASKIIKRLKAMALEGVNNGR